MIGIRNFYRKFASRLAEVTNFWQLCLSVLKHLKNIISWTIWTLVALYVLGLILVHLPPVQERLGSRVAAMLAKKLDTEVNIGRIDLGLFNRIIVDDVLIKDQADSTLLKVNRLSARIELLPLLNGRVSISSAQLFGAQAHVYKADSVAPLNMQFVLDAFASNDTTSQSGLDLRINSLIIRHSSARYDRYDVLETPGRLNTHHVNLSDISAHIQLRALRPDSVNLTVKRLAMREQSGLNVKRLSLRVEGNNEEAYLSDLQFQMPASLIRIDSLSAKYRFEGRKAALRFKGSAASPGLKLPDFAFIYPDLRKFSEALAFNVEFSGTEESFDIPRLNIHSESNDLSLIATLSASKQDERLIWSAPDYQLSASSQLIAQLKQAFAQIPDLATRLGDVRISGRTNRLASGDITSENDIATSIGRLSTLLTIGADKQFRGHLDTDSFHLGQLLDQSKLGVLATKVNLSGTPQAVNAEGTIARLDFNDYHYQGIELNATYSDGDIAGKLKIDDPNITTDVEGELRKGPRSAVRLTGFIRNLSPRALHLTDQWGDAQFSAIIDADFVASSLNDAEGSLDLDDFYMTRPDSAAVVYHLDNLHIKSGYEDDLHFMRLNGDMGEMELEGQFDWATLPQSFINYTGSKLPTLPGLPKTTRTSDNNFDVSIRLSDAQWLSNLFGLPLTLNRPLALTAKVNDQASELDINAEIPDFIYDGSQYAGGMIQLTTIGDTALCDARLTRLTESQRRMNLHLTAQAADNNLFTSLAWDNENRTDGDAFSGIINAITQLYTNDSGKPEAHVRVQPSRVNIQGTEWELEPSDILYSDQRLMVDRFNLRHDDQHLIVDGIASKQSSDSLMIDLNGIEVAYVLELVDFHAVDFGGKASGKAFITQAFSDFNAWADLEVADFTFQDGPMGTLVARAEWSKEDKQVELDAFADDGPDAQTFIEGFIAPSRDDINLLIRARGTNIAFVNSFTDSFLDRVSGQANGDVRLIGPLSGVNLTGELAVDGQATVTALNTTYQLRGDSIVFVPNDIQIQRHRIYDSDDHVGYVSGALHHRNFTNFTFDIDVEAQNLLAYDFNDFDDGTVCGHVFATGHADLHGRPGEITINCNVTPQRGSWFAYDAANPDAISNQQFITWGEKAATDSIGVLSDVMQIQPPTHPDLADMPSDIYINFIINTTPEATLRVLMDQQTNDYITLNGTGTLSASFYNKGPFQMFGTYNVERGTYGITIQNIIKKNFNFQEGGSIVFGGDPFDANLNLKAVYTVNGVSLSDLNIGNSFSNNTVRVNCLMNIQGTAGAPRVEFDLEMPTVNSEEEQMIRSIIASEQELNQQVVYLLGIGRFYTQGTNNAGTQQYGQTELAMQSFLSGTVSTQINELLSQVIKNDDWNFGANISTGNEGWHNAEYEGLVSGRMLNNRLLINGQFGYRDNATQATPSFIGDFDIRYLLLPNGNFALKVYNQTNDRYFTRSSLNTQGIGLIMKKDFNGLGDLFHQRRNRKSK